MRCWAVPEVTRLNIKGVLPHVALHVCRKLPHVRSQLERTAGWFAFKKELRLHRLPRVEGPAESGRCRPRKATEKQQFLDSHNWSIGLKEYPSIGERKKPKDFHRFVE